MTYLLQHFWPGGTEDRYRAQLAAVFIDEYGLPEEADLRRRRARRPWLPDYRIGWEGAGFLRPGHADGPDAS